MRGVYLQLDVSRRALRRQIAAARAYVGATLPPPTITSAQVVDTTALLVALDDAARAAR